MVLTIEGTYKNGKVELAEIPAGVGEARVFVTFLPAERDQRKEPEMTEDEKEALKLVLKPSTFDMTGARMTHGVPIDPRRIVREEVAE